MNDLPDTLREIADMPPEAMRFCLQFLADRLEAESARKGKDCQRQLVRRERMGVSSKAWAELRRMVLERDDYTCQYCGGYGDTVDHVVPLAANGETTKDNLVAACLPCNSSKRDRPVAEWEMGPCR